MYTRNPTYEGARGESHFRNECMRRNLIVSKPDTDLGRYDFVVDNRKEPLIKVQVRKLHFEKNVFKSPNFKYRNGEVEKHYTPDLVDFFVLIGLSEDEQNPLTEDIMYFIPTTVTANIATLYVCPHRPCREGSIADRLNPYLNQWHLIDGGKSLCS